ncbi:isoprenoid biosynthesis glyoxalase ElbB [Luteibaculum oceani]|uniref:Isoprenoid biosynthesis glyoxalase ElbB n=1 Tax=Luteibaculum oceani TaxID=1294296 RepID=A0A5C6VIK2_9FLAO|nr:isoprenoid biosynthesis glyoxalase ElbB [Luteibaculum oceani]TXC85213.1 isoprenoid biosynthesis glyoxalase ElbB [Luteibaculum oceani]
MKKVAVILSGCGVYDGSEIHEAVFTLLALAQNNISYSCFAPNKAQLHVIDHTKGEPTEESRNVLVESARIARGEIQDLKSLDVESFDGIAIPGGFGAAKNLNQWAISGPDGAIDDEVKSSILNALQMGKAIMGLCMGPTVIAKALEGSSYSAKLTVGTDTEESPYDIKGISDGMASIGAEVKMKSIREVMVDDQLKIVTAPCYMMQADITQIHDNIQSAVIAFKKLL